MHNGNSDLECAVTGATRASILTIRRWGSGSEGVFAWDVAGSARSRWHFLPDGRSRTTRPRQCQNSIDYWSIIPRCNTGCKYLCRGSVWCVTSYPLVYFKRCITLAERS